MRFFKKQKKAVLIFMIGVAFAVPTISTVPYNAHAAIIPGLAGGLAGCGGAAFAQKGLQKLDSEISNFLDKKFGIGGGEVPVAENKQRQKEGFSDCAVWVFINITLEEIIGSLTKWVQNGFDGNPAFIEDFDGLLKGAAGDAVGDFISRTNFAFLCSPFRTQIQISLINVATLDQRITCTLDEVTENIGDFIDGDFASGGWDGWYRLTQNPANNPYGAKFLIQSRLNQEVERRLEEESSLALFGNGYLSDRVCAVYVICDIEGPPEPADPDFEGPPDLTCPGGVKKRISADLISPDDSRILSCDRQETITPGATIEREIAEVLSIPHQRLTIADEINELFNALFQFLLTETFTGEGGLRGANLDEIREIEIDDSVPTREELCEEFPELELCQEGEDDETDPLADFCAENPTVPGCQNFCDQNPADPFCADKGNQGLEKSFTLSFNGTAGLVTFNPAPSGGGSSVCTSTCTRNFPTGTVVTLTASGIVNSVFDKWISHDGGTRRANPNTVTLGVDKAWQVFFK